MKESFVSIHHLNLKYAQKAVLTDLNWVINRGENWLLNGESGSGKTSLAKAIAGLNKTSGTLKVHFDTNSMLSAEVLYVANWYPFKNLEGVANFYYQQRYTSQAAPETHTVNTELINYGAENKLQFTELESLFDAFGFSSLVNAQLIQLSSGEHKKLQLIKALWLKPQLLILDEPYTGLDLISRGHLNHLLDEIVSKGVQLLLISNETDLPLSISHFTVLKNGKLQELLSKKSSPSLAQKPLKEIPAFLSEKPAYTTNSLVKMTDVAINYGEKQVLKGINWEIKPGEKWLLQGHNGSGKSTLLSLINGDHPQAYANDIHLFGNKRGSGESIWDIKKNIGLISPEFHWYFDAQATVWQSIASGFFDSVGLFRELPYEKQNQVNELIGYFELEDYKNEPFKILPLSKQRLVLLARTMIKNPILLILDEPCQGLDHYQTQHFNRLVDELCSYGKTLIYVAHTESDLPTCLDQQLLLNKGEIIKNTTSYQIQKEPA
ncbi:MAG: ATP-binding cassette domain-containing protein [Bacteroidota bacterium]